mgnify:CR=1 FL=1
MTDYHVVSFSGGKDSTAMLLRMFELGYPVDEVLFCDTGCEFPEMYKHIDKVNNIVERYLGKKITILKAEHSFEYMLLEYKFNPRPKEGIVKPHAIGRSWATMRTRWCTKYFKVDLIKRHLRGIDADIHQYVGIAADEPNRIRELNYPLVSWGWREVDCLSYCYKKGLDWGGLYNKYKRLSCWCCPLQSLNDLRTLRHEYPELWRKLLEWEHRAWSNFRADYSVDELDARFAHEDDNEKMLVRLF